MTVSDVRVDVTGDGRRPTVSLRTPVEDGARLGRVARRDDALDRPAHDDRTAAVLGIALGVSFTVCFLTGLYSHLLQQPPTWIAVPPSPAGLYRITQGLHVATGIAVDPPAARQALVGLPPAVRAGRRSETSPTPSSGSPSSCSSAGSLFMLFTGTANIERWYPWRFFFPAGHYWAAWITIGALVVHIGAKLPVVRRVFAVAADPNTPLAPAPGLGRRGFLAATAAASGLLTLFTVGQTVGPLGRLAFFSPRRPDIGPQGLPVNATAVEAGVIDAATVRRATACGSPGRSATELSAHPGRPRGHGPHQAVLPIACVEGWSASARWGGVPVARPARRRRRRPGTDVTVDVQSLERTASTASRSWPETRPGPRHAARPHHRRGGSPRRPRLPRAPHRRQPARRAADQVGRGAGGPMMAEPATMADPDRSPRRAPHRSGSASWSAAG